MAWWTFHAPIRAGGERVNHKSQWDNTPTQKLPVMPKLGSMVRERERQRARLYNDRTSVLCDSFDQMKQFFQTDKTNTCSKFCDLVVEWLSTPDNAATESQITE